jgi:hypothetical protein
MNMCDGEIKKIGHSEFCLHISEISVMTNTNKQSMASAPSALIGSGLTVFDI